MTNRKAKQESGQLTSFRFSATSGKPMQIFIAHKMAIDGVGACCEWYDRASIHKYSKHMSIG